MTLQQVVRTVDVGALRIRCEVSGDSADTIVLIHGSGAHRAWWHLMVPDLARTHRVIAMDLSGHGDSDRRPSYSPLTHAEEVTEVAGRLGSGSVHLVAHSMGGRVAIAAASTNPRNFASVTLLDTWVPDPGQRMDPAPGPKPSSVYADEESIRRRFRLLPDQPPPPPEALAPVIDHGIHLTDAGWAWKFDPRTLLSRDDAAVNAALASIEAPFTYAYGAKSSVRSHATAAKVRRLHPDAHVLPVEGGHHHLPLDSPDACVELVRESVSRAV